MRVKLSSLTIHQKIQLLRKQLNRDCLERAYEVDCLLALFITRQHGLMLGKPGTGKTYLIEKICDALASGASFFDMLVTADSRIEEFFGPVSINELKNNEVYKRNTAGKLPEATFAYLDEIFKLNSPTLNALLKLINERIFYNPESIKVPLRTLIGSSNEVPEDSTAEALVDRFTWKTWVDYLKKDVSTMELWMRDIEGYKSQVTVKLNLTDLDAARELVNSVDLKSSLQLLQYLKNRLKDAGFVISDRKWLSVNRFLQAYSWLQGDNIITIDTIKKVLPDCIWNNPAQIKDVKTKIRELIKEYEKNVENLKVTAIASLANAENYAKQNNLKTAHERVLDARLVVQNLTIMRRQGFNAYEAIREIDLAAEKVQVLLLAAEKSPEEVEKADIQEHLNVHFAEVEYLVKQPFSEQWCNDVLARNDSLLSLLDRVRNSKLLGRRQRLDFEGLIQDASRRLQLAMSGELAHV